MNMNVDSIKAALKHKIVFFDQGEYLGVSIDEINQLCENGYAYKISHNGLIGRKYLLDYIYSQAKKKGYHELSLTINDCMISKDIVHENLERLMFEGLMLKKDDTLYLPNISKILSLEAIKSFCRYKIDAISLENIVLSFGFDMKTEGGESVSEAKMHCSKVIEQLKTDEFLTSSFIASLNTDVYFWNSKHDERQKTQSSH